MVEGSWFDPFRAPFTARGWQRGLHGERRGSRDVHHGNLEGGSWCDMKVI